MLIDFFDLVPVTDSASAVAAIDRITLQGEGNVDEREDSHYGVFLAIKRELERLGDDGAASRPVADNPYVRRRRDQIPAAFVRADTGVVQTEIVDAVSILAVDLFDDAYVSMLQALGYVFANADSEPDVAPRMAQSSLELMTTVLKPLGEAICLLPSGQPGINAGPTFAMSRHSHLPPAGTVAAVVYGERLAELATHGARLAAFFGAGPG